MVEVHNMAILEFLFSILLSLLTAFGGLIGMFSTKDAAPEDAIQLKYGAGKCEYLNIYLPEDTTEAKDVLFLVHGGAWIFNDESDFDENCRQAAKERGLVAVTMDYNKFQDGADCEDMLNEIDAAMNATKDKLTELGVPMTGNLILSGHSAGAQLSDLYAYTRYDTCPFKICFVVSNCAPTDFETDATAKTTTMGKLATITLSALAGKFVMAGATDEESRALIDSVNPIKQIDANCPPTIVVQGNADEMVPYQNGVDLYEALKAAGIDTCMITYEGAGHFLGAEFTEGNAARAAAFDEYYAKYCVQ